MAYGVDAASLDLDSRGRGSRPPEDARAPRKMALHLAVLASGCSYAALAAHIGYHRDTVTSACIDVRDAISADDDAELNSRRLEALVRANLAANGRGAIAVARARLATLEALYESDPDPSSDSFPTFIRHETGDHENVITMIQKADAA